jgi:hypothetical protein
VALAEILGADTPSDAVDALESAIAYPAGPYLDPGLEQTERALDETLVFEQACTALSRLDRRRRIAIFLRSLGEIADPERAHRAALLLLDSALLGLARQVNDGPMPEATEQVVSFGVKEPKEAENAHERIYPRAKPPLDVTSLTPVQRQAVRAVLDNPAVWVLPSNLFELYGLPASPVVVRERISLVSKQ